MKILFIVHISSIYEGSNRSIMSSIEGLREKGINPFVIVPSIGSLTSYLEEKRIEYLVIPYKLSIFPKTRSISDYLIFIPKLLKLNYENYNAYLFIKRVIVEHKIDLVHTNVGPLFIGFRAARKLNIPHVWHIREYQDLDFGIRCLGGKSKFIRKINSNYNYPIAITQALKNYFSLKRDGVVIYNGIRSRNTVFYSEDKHPYFLYIGRLSNKKGVEDLLVTFKNFQYINKKFKLLLAGDSRVRDYKDSLVDFVKENGLINYVTFLGEVSNVDDYLQKSTALIVPSYFEGFGRITAEAMFNGCLVIGRNTGGTKEILTYGSGMGLTFTSNEELLDHMITIAENGLDSFKLRILEAQQTAKKLYSTEENVNRIFNLYQQILYHGK